MNICSLLITAYQSADYILDTLESLHQQSLPANWQIKFYIGVDSCNETASILNKNNIPYYYSYNNVGTYILTNSLIQKAKQDNCDVFVRFDSDDIACENFLLYGIEHAVKNNFVSPYQILVDKDLNVINDDLKVAHGSMFATRKAIDLLGGYYSYRVGCDTNFFRRANRLGLGGVITEKKPVYLYRQHTKSLMKNKQLGKGTNERKMFKKEMRCKFLAGENTIQNPVITDLKYIL